MLGYIGAPGEATIDSHASPRIHGKRGCFSALDTENADCDMGGTSRSKSTLRGTRVGGVGSANRQQL